MEASWINKKLTKTKNFDIMYIQGKENKQKDEYVNVEKRRFCNVCRLFD